MNRLKQLRAKIKNRMTNTLLVSIIISILLSSNIFMLYVMERYGKNSLIVIGIVEFLFIALLIKLFCPEPYQDEN